MQYNNISFD